MQPNSFALNWGPNCLFKGQVILSKQITPASQCAGVVFLQQNSSRNLNCLCRDGENLVMQVAPYHQKTKKNSKP